MAVVELKAREEATSQLQVSVKGMAKTVQRMVLMADAMGVAQAKSKTLAVLLQQEPGVPMEDFSFDATEVIKEVKSLKPGFEGKAKDLKVQEAKDHGEHTLLMQSLIDEKKAAEKSLGDAKKRLDAFLAAVAQHHREVTEIDLSGCKGVTDAGL